MCVPSSYHVTSWLFSQHPSGLHHFRSVYQQGAPSFLETGNSPTVPGPDCTEDARRCPNGIVHAGRLVSAGQYADVHCRATEQFHAIACLFFATLSSFDYIYTICIIVKIHACARFGLYGGCSNMSQWNCSLSKAWVCRAICGRALSCNRTIPRAILPLRQDNLRYHRPVEKE